MFRQRLKGAHRVGAPGSMNQSQQNQHPTQQVVRDINLVTVFAHILLVTLHLFVLFRNITILLNPLTIGSPNAIPC